MPLPMDRGIATPVFRPVRDDRKIKGLPQMRQPVMGDVQRSSRK